MSISFILVTFLFQMAVGMIATVALLPPALVDRRFFKSISFWTFLFTLIALILQYKATFHLPEVFGQPVGEGALLRRLSQILFLFFLAMTFAQWFHLRFFSGQVTRAGLVLIASIGLSAILVDSLVYRPAIPPLWIHSVLLPLHFLSASLVLGGFLAGMIFGHYYLVNTDMPKRLLVTMAWILIAILMFRFLAVGVSLLSYRELVYPGENFLEGLISFAGHGIFFWQRILVGLLVPAVVVAMIWSTARIGSNQSATGIMYVAIAFVFIGELAARYLFLLSAIPL
ncbi:MAG: hypothetical protein HYT77_04110 [Deltaproteobacteria bacterium]|nr:hypothetical protein [Deltaproteobacteria bacterium]